MPAQGAPTPTTSLAWMLVVAGRRAETEEPVGMAICLVRAIPLRCSSGSRAVLPGRTSGPRSWRRGGGASLVLLDRTSRPRSWCCEAAAIFALLSVTLTGGLFLYPERFPQPAVPSGAKLAVDSHNRLSPMGPSWPWLPSPKRISTISMISMKISMIPMISTISLKISMISDDLCDLYTERRSDRIGSLSREVPTAGSPLGGRVGSGFPQPAVPYGAKLAVASLSKADKLGLYGTRTPWILTLRTISPKLMA